MLNGRINGLMDRWKGAGSDKILLYRALKKEMEMLERGELDDHLESMLEQAQA